MLVIVVLEIIIKTKFQFYLYEKITKLRYIA